MKMIADCCDSVVVLNAGRQIAAGSPADCLANAAVQRAYFGATAAGVAETRAAAVSGSDMHVSHDERAARLRTARRLLAEASAYQKKPSLLGL